MDKWLSKQYPLKSWSISVPTRMGNWSWTLYCGVESVAPVAPAGSSGFSHDQYWRTIYARYLSAYYSCIPSLVCCKYVLFSKVLSSSSPGTTPAYTNKSASLCRPSRAMQALCSRSSACLLGHARLAAGDHDMICLRASSGFSRPGTTGSNRSFGGA